MVAAIFEDYVYSDIYSFSQRLEVVKFAQKYAENYHPIQTILDESEIMNVATGG